MDVDRFRVKPGKPLRLADIDPAARPGFEGKKADGVAALAELTPQLDRLQELFYADGRHRLLVVFQAMDAGGKDGTIRSVFEGVNPQGVSVVSFKVPTPDQAAHDFLWRVHPHAPGNGEVTVFNRSHYEDVLVVRVHDLVPEARWRRRYHHIREFEQLLVDEGTTIVKFFLHISKDEQARRLQERIDDPRKHWKFSHADLEERKRWDDYAAAYQDAIHETSTTQAPWYVVPGNRNWYRNLVVATVMLNTFQSLDLRYPDPPPGLDGLKIT